ncbi:MAG: hypothetical protein AB7O56_00760 [Bauldia sp.]
MIGTARRRTSSLVALVTALLLAACGDDDSAGDEPVAAEPVAAEPVAAAPGGTPAPGVAGAEAIPANPVIEALELNDWYRAILVNPDAVADPRDLEAIARPYCEGLDVCRAAIWFDVRDLPRAMPVPARQIEEQAFALGRTITGEENILWNCDIFPEFEAERACLPRPMR